VQDLKQGRCALGRNSQRRRQPGCRRTGLASNRPSTASSFDRWWCAATRPLGRIDPGIGECEPARSSPVCHRSDDPVLVWVAGWERSSHQGARGYLGVADEPGCWPRVMATRPLIYVRPIGTAPTEALGARWGNGLATAQRSSWMWSSLRVMVCMTGARTCPAPSIIEEERPWSIMPGSTCRWKVPACALWVQAGIVCEAKVASEPDALIRWFGKLGVEVSRIGLEAGPLSQWLYGRNAGSRASGGATGGPARA
jgi:hypothetical protein